jgi:ABC-type antimicrobial peptide transport system permease subunit
MIVGVVGDVKHQSLRSDIVPTVYRPYFQDSHPTGVQVYLRTRHDPETAEAAIQQTMHDLDPTLVVDQLRTMEVEVDVSASNERALALLAVGFAVLAAILAAVGLYGVLAYSTQNRTREMAWIAGIAALVALPATVALARLFTSQLYGVSTWDPVTLGGALLLTALMVALASALPARRATAVDPMEALRTE